MSFAMLSTVFTSHCSLKGHLIILVVSSLVKLKYYHNSHKHLKSELSFTFTSVSQIIHFGHHEIEMQGNFEQSFSFIL